MHGLDDMDRKLLRLLQEDCERSNADLARQAGLSSGACWRRLVRLETAGVIAGWTVEIDHARLGYTVDVFLRVTLDKTAPNAFDRFLAAARAVPEMTELQTLLGRVDIRMGVRARDLAHYQEIYRSRILTLPHIAEIDALMLVADVKRSGALPL